MCSTTPPKTFQPPAALGSSGIFEAPTVMPGTAPSGNYDAGNPANFKPPVAAPAPTPKPPVTTPGMRPGGPGIDTDDEMVRAGKWGGNQQLGKQFWGPR